MNQGDAIRIPKGTPVFEFTSYSQYLDPPTPSRRDIDTVVASISDASDGWMAFASKDSRDDIVIAAKMLTGKDHTDSLKYLPGWLDEEERFGSIMRDGWHQHRGTLVPLLDKAKAATDALVNGDYSLVTWGTGSKRRAARLCDVMPRVAVEKAPKGEAKITKRKMMVVGSKWRFTKDTPIDVWVGNPARRALSKKEDAIYRSDNSEHQRGGTRVIVLGGGQKNTPAEEAEMAAIRAQRKALPQQIIHRIAVIAAGTEIEITGKLVSSGANHLSKKESNGLMVPMRGANMVMDTSVFEMAYENPLRGGGLLPYAQIEHSVEPLAIPEVIAYILRDAATGEYFGGWKFEIDKYGQNRSTNTPKMSKTISGAKKYATSSAAKASIRDFTGYTSGMQEDGDSAPYWAQGGDKKMDLPETWEMVAFDKATNTEKEIIDVQNWYQGLMRLRDLTVRFGPGVRAVYKKAEGREGIEAILVFKSEDPLKDYGDVPHVLQAINRVCADFPKGTISETLVCTKAYATTLDLAVMAKLSFPKMEGVTVSVFDIATLEEVVESAQAKVEV